MTRFGFLSTYPPTRCGLATFTDALASAIADGQDATIAVVRVLDLAEDPPPPCCRPVVADLVPGDPSSAAGAAGALNACDVVIAQHEYGIYGGEDGEEMLAVLDGLLVPSIVVLHTVLETPTAHQREVLERVCKSASAVVVMTEAARVLLGERYGTTGTLVRVIPHGVHPPPAASPDAHGAPGRRRVLTWGLLGPGKGIEWGVRAMTLLTDLTPPVEYLVLGETHPKVRANEGERYRTMLHDLAAGLGVADSVVLDGRYLAPAELAQVAASADVVLLPYDSREQTTSGVLAEAVAAGVPVVATRFPHAVELLSDGAGVLVAHEDPEAVAAALRAVLGHADVAVQMAATGARRAQRTSWAEVARSYRALAAEVMAVKAA